MRVSLTVLCTVLAFAAAPRTQSAQIIVEARIAAAETHGPVVTGSMELTLVNAMDVTLANVRLALTPPAAGALGEGAVEIGTVDVDATVVRAVDFRLDTGSFDSGEPIPLTVSYEDQAGQRHERRVAARRQSTGGGL